MGLTPPPHNPFVNELEEEDSKETYSSQNQSLYQSVFQVRLSYPNEFQYHNISVRPVETAEAEQQKELSNEAIHSFCILDDLS